MPFVPVSGNSGRVAQGAGSTAVAGLNAWEMVKKTTGIRVYHFEGALDSETTSNMYPAAILPGTSEATCTFSGHMNTDATDKTDATLSNGKTVTMDFILVKGTPFGFANVPVFIESITIGTSIGTEAAKFSGEGVVVGAPGGTGTIA